MKDMKGILVLLTLVFLCVEFLPHYVDDFSIDKIELAESDEHESESETKEKEIEDLKDYLFNNIKISDNRLVESHVPALKKSVILNLHYSDVFTPPPEHSSNFIC